jgi:glycine hydroxymethyltransferase
LVDMTNKGVTGNQMSKALDAAGIVCNYNLVPGDPRSARRPSGIRLGTPSITSRGFGGHQMIQLADWMDEIAQIRADESIDRDARREAYRRVADEVRDLCDRFPAPGLDIA